MNHLANDDTADAGNLVLPLTDIAHLFNAPRIDPHSRSPVEVLGVSGVDYLLNLLHMDKQRQRARTLSLLLPPEKASGTLAEPAASGLHRLVELRLEQQRRDLHTTYRYGWKVAGIALVLMAVCLALASVFTSELTEWMPPLTRHTLEYGFEIIGWVVLWHPLDVLVFKSLAIRSKMAALQTLTAVDVLIRADQIEKQK